MERPEWEEPVDADAVPLYPAAPIPLHERSWRHPSELGVTSTFLAPPTPELHRGVLIAASLVGLACVIGLALVLLPGDPPADSVSKEAGSQLVATSLSRSARSTARPWMGVDGRDATDGVLVATVAADSPAHSSGLRSGDVIVAIGGTPVRDEVALRAALDQSEIGTPLALTVMRAGVAHDLVVWLEAEP